MICESNDETNVLHKLLLTDRQVSGLRKAFVSCSSTNVEFSKTQLPRMMQSGGVISDISIFGNILLSVAEKGTIIARSFGEDFLDMQIDKFNKEYITGAGITLTNNEIKDIVKVIKSLEDKWILLKGTTR